MEEFAPALAAALSRPRPVSCPPWCTDGLHHDLDPPGTALHRSPPATVAVYDEACELVVAHMWAAFWDKAPEWIGTDPAELERPHVEVSIPDGGGGGVLLYLTPGQARSFAAALVRAADAADTEVFYRTPVSLDRQCAVTAGLMPRHRSAWMGHGCPTAGHPPRSSEGNDMASPTPAARTIEVDEQVYDVLDRTARSRDTDINGALKYLLEAPAVTAVSSQDDVEE